MKKRRVLDKGFVILDNVSGTDLDVVRSARVSYGKDITTPERDKKLINFLMRNNHKTPFEHVVFRFHIKCPLFVARQWVRHRWASVNEISGRYTRMKNEIHIPSYFRKRVGKNYEYENMSEEKCNELYTRFKNFHTFAYNFYEKLLNKYDLCEEQAREILPLALYTEFYFTVNVRSLMNFLKLRQDKHAQKEIRDYANVLFDYFKEYMPWTAEAFLKYYSNDHLE